MTEVRDSSEITYVIDLSPQYAERLERIAAMEEFAGKVVVEEEATAGDYHPFISGPNGRIQFPHRQLPDGRKAYYLHYDSQEVWDGVHKQIESGAGMPETVGAAIDQSYDGAA